jgi:hypothetical protein
MAVQASGWGRWRVRLVGLLGGALVVVACLGWWLDTRVVDDDGFADVVARTSQRQEVRDYAADQATLRLARTSNFVSAARPAVTDAVAAAMATPPVEDAVRDFARRAHQQVFEVRAARRVDIDAQQTSVAVRSALQSINPAMAKKLPANVLDASATISQNRLVDGLLRVSNWIWLWIPIGLAGIALLGWTLRRSADRVGASRSIGVTLAVMGALLAGLGLAAPAVAAVVAPTDPARANAIAAFVEVLTGRLAGSGLALVVIGLALALAPGRDGGDLRDRVQRFRAWVSARAAHRGWRFAAGAGIVLLATSCITRPGPTARIVLDLAAFTALYVGVVVCLRAAGVLTTDHTIRPLRRRWLAVVAGAMAFALFGSVAMVASIASATTSEPRADELRSGCNGDFELCAQPPDQIVWPAAHNAMSSSAYDFFSAEHTITVADQLNAGARFLMLDVYYGYDDHGIVRTNLAGGVDRAELEKERGKEAVDALDRLGALTGTADTSGKRQDVYLCHDFCELGAVKAVDVFREIDRFLDRNLTDMVVLDFEDYVRPEDLRGALVESGLWDRVRTVTPTELHTVPLGYLLAAPKGERENPRRVVTVSEKHGKRYAWLPATYSLFQETPFTFSRIGGFSCAPNRGGDGKSMFLVNHWLRPDGPPDPSEAAKVNSRRTLLERFRTCAAERSRLPNVIAADFTEVGDLYRTVRELNGAIAEISGVTHDVDAAIERAVASGELSQAQVDELRGLHRLPGVSRHRAEDTLGPARALLTRPAALDKLEADNCLVSVPDTGLPRGPAIDPRYEQAPDPSECTRAEPTPGADPTSTTTTAAR